MPRCRRSFCRNTCEFSVKMRFPDVLRFGASGFQKLWEIFRRTYFCIVMRWKRSTMREASKCGRNCPFGGIGIVSAPKEWVRNLQKNECRWQGTKRCFGRQFILTASGNPDCSTVQSQTTRASIPYRMLALRFSIHLQSSKISTRFSPERCWRVWHCRNLSRPAER